MVGNIFLEPHDQRLLQTTSLEIQTSTTAGSVILTSFQITQKFYWFILEKFYHDTLASRDLLLSKAEFWVKAERFTAYPQPPQLWESLLPDTLESITEEWNRDFPERSTEIIRLIVNVLSQTASTTIKELESLVDGLRHFTNFYQTQSLGPLHSRVIFGPDLGREGNQHLIDFFRNPSQDVPAPVQELVGSFCYEYWKLDQPDISTNYEPVTLPKESSLHNFTEVLLPYLERHGVPLGDRNYYLWSYTNPFHYWTTKVQDIYLVARNNPVYSTEFFTKCGASLENVERLLNGDILAEHITDEPWFLRLVYQLCQHRPVNITSRPGEWIFGNPSLIQEEGELHIQITTQPNQKTYSLDQVQSPRNNFCLISAGLSDLRPEIRDLYFLPMKPLHFTNSLSFDESVVSVTTDKNWGEINSIARVGFSLTELPLATSTISRENLNINLVLPYPTKKNRAININILKVFNQFSLSDKFLASYLNSDSTYQSAMKLYSPNVLFMSSQESGITSNEIVAFLKRQVIFGEQPSELIRLANVCFLAKIGIQQHPVKTRMAEVMELHLGNGSLRFIDNNSFRQHVPIRKVLVDQTQADDLTVGDHIMVHDFSDFYGLISLYCNGRVELHCSLQNIRPHTGKRYIRQAQACLEKFVDAIQVTRYLTSPLYHFPVNLDYQTDLSTSSHLQEWFILELKEELQLAHFRNLVDMFKPLTGLLRKDFLPNQLVEIWNSDTDEWEIIKILEIREASEELLVEYLGNGQNRLVIISDETIRFITDNDSRDQCHFLWSTSPLQTTYSEIEVLIAQAKLWSISDLQIIKLLIQQFKISKVEAENIYRRYKFSRLPANTSRVIIRSGPVSEEHHNYQIMIESSVGIKYKIIDWIQQIVQLYYKLQGHEIQLDIPISFDTIRKYWQEQPATERISLLTMDAQPISTDKDDYSNLFNISGSEPDIHEENGKGDGEEEDDGKSDNDDDDEYEEGDGKSDDEEGDVGDEEGEYVLGETDEYDQGYEPDPYEYAEDPYGYAEEPYDDEGDEIQEMEAEDQMLQTITKHATSSITDEYLLDEEGDQDSTRLMKYHHRESGHRWTPTTSTGVKSPNPSNPYLDRVNNYLIKREDITKEVKEHGKRKGKLRNNYSTECQGEHRQPMIITAETKNFIDTYYPGAYGTEGNYTLTNGNVVNNIVCDGSTSVDTKNEQCIAIKMDPKHWFVCHLLTCFYDWVPLILPQMRNYGNIDPSLLIKLKLAPDQDINELQQEYGVTQSNYDTIQELVDDPEAGIIYLPCLKYQPKDPTYRTSQWLVCKCCNLSIFEHHLECPICHHGIIEKGKNSLENRWASISRGRESHWKIKPHEQNDIQWQQCRKDISYQQIVDTTGLLPELWRQTKQRISTQKSVDVQIADNNKIYKFPAFKNTLVPCCYQENPTNWLNNVNVYFGHDVEKKQESIHLLRDSKFLPPHRMGYLPEQIINKLGFKCDRSNISGKDSSCLPGFVRYGVPMSENTFLESVLLIANSIPDQTTLTYDKFIQEFVRLMNYQTFQRLSNGSLEILFTDQDLSVSAFQNYLEYTISRDNKVDYLYLDALETPLSGDLAIPGPKIFQVGIKIIILSYHEDDDDLQVLCSPTTSPLSYDRPVAFLIKLDRADSMPNYEILTYHYGKNSAKRDQFIFQFRQNQSSIIETHPDMTVTLGESLYRRFKKALQGCRRHPQMSDLAFNQTFTYNPLTTSLGRFRTVYLQGSIELQIKGQQINSYHKLVGIQLNNGHYIPVYPQTPLVNVDNLSEDWPQDISTTMVNLLNYHGQDFTCAPRWVVVNQSNETLSESTKIIRGFLTEEGYFVKCLDQRVLDIKLAVDDLQSKVNVPLDYIEYDVETLDRILQDTRSFGSHINYPSPLETKPSLDILTNLAEQESQWKPMGYVEPDASNMTNPLPSIILQNGLQVPVRLDTPPHLEKCTQDATQWVLESGEMIPVLSLDQVVKLGKVLYNYSNGKLLTRGYRLVMDHKTKMYHEIILENGGHVPIQDVPFFHTHSDGTVEYPMMSIPYIHLPVLSRNYQNSNYQRRYADARVKFQELDNSDQRYYRSVRRNLAEFLNNIQECQQFLGKLVQNTLWPVYLKVQVTKLLLLHIMELLINVPNQTYIVENPQLIKSSCQYHKQSTCTNESHCYWNSQSDLISFNKSLHYLMEHGVKLLIDQDDPVGAGDPRVNRLDTILTTVRDKFPHSSGHINSGFCQLKIHNTGDKSGDMNNRLAPQYYDLATQLAEEIVRVGTRSREILRNRIIDPTSQDFVFDESNEYLITNPTEDQLVKIMAQTYTRKYLSGVVPFDLASNTNLQMYQTVQVEDTEVESIGETGVTINDIPTKFPVTRSGHYQLTVLESFSKILTGRPKQLEVTHQLNEQQHQQLNSIFRQINRVYPIKNVDTYQIKPIGHPDLLLSLWNLNASGMTKTF